MFPCNYPINLKQSIKTQWKLFKIAKEKIWIWGQRFLKRPNLGAGQKRYQANFKTRPGHWGQARSDFIVCPRLYSKIMEKAHRGNALNLWIPLKYTDFVNKECYNVHTFTGVLKLDYLKKRGIIIQNDKVILIVQSEHVWTKHLPWTFWNWCWF